jgi:putative flippase GtrA
MFAQFHASTLLMGIIFNWLVLVGVTEFFGLNPNISNLIAILVGNIGAVLNFLFSHRFTFRRKHTKPDDDHSADAGTGLAS